MPMQPGQPPGGTLELIHLSKRYAAGSVVVWENLGLGFSLGEITCLVGPSGCGKTTLLLCIAGLEDHEGSIQVDGRVVGGPGSDRCLVFQDYAMVPWRNVVRNITLGLELNANWRPRATREAVARELIKLTGLEGFEQAFPGELSGGMQQRVAIARALAVDPAILLMDEPFGALDALTRRRMGEELIHIWEQTRKTILFVTHSVEEALALADRVVVFSDRPMRVLEDIRLARPRPGAVTDESVQASRRILAALGFTDREGGPSRNSSLPSAAWAAG